MGKRVLHPTEIENWDRLQIFVPKNYYQEIRDTLLKKGLKENVDFFKYADGYLDLSEKKIQQDTNKFLNEIIDNISLLQDKIVVISYCAAFDKGSCNFLNRLSENFDMAFLSDAIWINKEETEKKIKFPVFVLPNFVGFDTYPECNEELMVSDEIRQYVSQKDYLINSSCNITQGTNRTDQYGILASYYADKLYRQIFQMIHPSKIITTTTFPPFHRIVKGICEEMNISVIHMHAGVLYGTFTLEERGEMGESYPAVYAEEFRELPVDNGEKEKTRKIWEFLQQSSANRKVQPQHNLDDIFEKTIKKNRPIIFYAGQNDFSSGLQPYNEDSEKYHSPMFKSSMEAAAYLEQICIKNDWNFIYKPHPMSRQQRTSLSAKTIYVEYGNINELVDRSDVTITVLSQTAYVSLIRHKPVVMLGYTQLKGKECTYEAFEKDKIENQIKNALTNSFTERQKDGFLVHMTQLLKYYLYDDLTERPIRYGRRIPKDWSEVEELKNMLENAQEEGNL